MQQEKSGISGNFCSPIHTYKKSQVCLCREMLFRKNVTSNAGNIQLSFFSLAPFNAEATFIQNTGMQRLYKNHLNPVMLVFIR